MICSACQVLTQVNILCIQFLANSLDTALGKFLWQVVVLVSCIIKQSGQDASLETHTMVPIECYDEVYEAYQINNCPVHLNTKTDGICRIKNTAIILS